MQNVFYENKWRTYAMYIIVAQKITIVLFFLWNLNAANNTEYLQALTNIYQNLPAELEL